MPSASHEAFLWVIKSRRMRWARYIACMGERRGSYRVFVGNQRELDYLEDPGIDGRIILKRNLEKRDGGMHGRNRYGSE